MSVPSGTPPRPYPALRIGVVGHRLTALVDSGTDLTVLRNTVRGLLEQIQAGAQAVGTQYPSVFAGPAHLRVISALAEGTDQIVADEAIRIGYTLHVPLPCLPAIYTAAFQGADSAGAESPRAAFARLIGQAQSVQVLDGSPNATLDGAAYAEVGRAVVRHSDLLIGIWDGEPAAGAGGTGDVIDQARTWQVPLVRIDPRHPERWTFEANTEVPARQELDAAIREMLVPPIQHPPTEVTSPLQQYLTTRSTRGVGGIFVSLLRLVAGEWPPIRLMTLAGASIDRARSDWNSLWTTADPGLVHALNHGLEEPYVWAEGLGNRYGTLHRDASSAPYVLAPLAVLLALVAHWWNTPPESIMPEVVGWIEVAVLGGIVVTYQKAVVAQYHDRWIDYRSLAEELRQLAFLWPLGRPLPVVQLVGETEGEAQRFAWVGWYVRAVARDLGLCPGVWTPERLTDMRTVLAERFIGYQCAYHDRTMKRFDRVHARLDAATYRIFFFALGLAVAHVVLFDRHSWLAMKTHFDLRLLDTDPFWSAVVRAGAVLAIFLPALGAAVHGFLSQGDFWNLARRSERMCAHLRPLAVEVSATTPTTEALGIVAEKAADVMRDEVVYWRVFVRLKPPALV
jgi:hypothetical protein